VTQIPMSDDSRAEQQWAAAAAKSVFKFIVPGWWPLAISAVLGFAGWALVCYAALTLGVLACVVLVLWVAASAAVSAYWVKRIHHDVTGADKTASERTEHIRTKWAQTQAKPYHYFLKTGRFWWLVASVTMPKTVIIAYALRRLGLPVGLAVALAAVPLVWAFVGRLIPNRRLDPAMSMLIAERPAGGLPTPEV
jgi:hypothetical protein